MSGRPTSWIGPCAASPVPTLTRPRPTTRRWSRLWRAASSRLSTASKGGTEPHFGRSTQWTGDGTACRSIWTGDPRSAAGLRSRHRRKPRLRDRTCCLLRREESDQRFRRLSLLRTSCQRSGKAGVLLQLRRNRADKVNARLVDQLADLLEPDLRLPAGDDGGDWFAGGWAPHLPALARQLLRHAESGEQHRGKIDAARAVGVSDRFGLEQRAPERVDSADVWLATPCTHDHADLRASQVDLRLRS